MKAECREPPEDNTALGALSTPRPRGQGIERSQEPREKEQCAWKAATLLMVKSLLMQSTHASLPGTPHCRQQTWRKQREATITDQRREKGPQGKRRREKDGVPGHRDTDVLEAGKRGEHVVRPGSMWSPCTSGVQGTVRSAGMM